jgi:hypothetical protein
MHDIILNEMLLDVNVFLNKSNEKKIQRTSNFNYIV